jgi:hypothetical protein
MPLFTFLGQVLFARLPFCSKIGAIAGAVAGALMGMAMGAIVPGGLTMAGIFEAAGMLAVAGWITVLILVGVWLRYGLAQIWAPAALNALLTALLTVWVNNLVRLPWAATLLGILAGVLVGAILCRLCGPWGDLGKSAGTGAADAR